MTDKINGKTPEEIKKGLECNKCIKCSYHHEDCGYMVDRDAIALIQKLENELEPLRKAKEEGRLIILPYAPGTPVYVVDDYEVIQMQYHPSMYGRRCNTSKEELYKEFHKELEAGGEKHGTEGKDY